MSQIPLMILSDAPSSFSGLGRITRELGQRIVSNLSDKYRLATLGYGGVGSIKLPWQQYTICGDLPYRNWFVPELYTAWQDWAGEEKGVLLTIWDATRLVWLVDLNLCPDTVMRPWLESKPFEKWGYWPVDAEGVDHKLPHGYAEVMRRYDRNLAYSEWARGLMRNEGIEAEALPHGIDTSVWFPRDRKQARAKVQSCGLSRLGDNSFLVGVVATNQARKDWALAFATCAELLKRGHDVLMWCHIDIIHRYWDIVALAKDFGMINRVLVSQPPMKDGDMAEMYSACDVTLGIGLGEGFGYPIFESLSCGVPSVHGDYGGAAEHLIDHMKVQPAAPRYEGQFNCLRPVFDPDTWVSAVLRETINRDPKRTPLSFPSEIDWNNLWPRWEKWLRNA